jgi:hypothetical protein
MVAHPYSKQLKDNTNPEVGINLYLIVLNNFNLINIL